MKRHAGAVLSSIKIDKTAEKKISIQLYMALRDLLLTGALTPGDRMPATRTLAQEIGVSRTTVIDAIDRLIAEGLLEARVGAGTFVSEALNARLAPKPSPEASDITPVVPRLSHATRHAIPDFTLRSRLPHKSQAFVTALPALDAFPMAQWAKLSARHWRKDRDHVAGYGEPFGYMPLRRAIARQLNASRGIKCDPEQIFITNGAQRAFSLVGGMLVNPGEPIWFENPGAIGARNAFVAIGARPIPVAVDEEGLCIEDGLAKAPYFRLAFVTPSHQQPLGHVMSLSRRLALLKAANEADAMIVEDDYDGEFYFGDQPPPTLKSIDTHGRVIYIGTFSKSLFPALRLGFVLVPEGLVESFERVCLTWLAGVPTVTQAIVAEFMDEGMFATHIRTMRQLYKHRHDTLMAEAAGLAGEIDLQPTSSGFHAVGLVSDRYDEDRIVSEAAKHGITTAPLSRYALGRIPQRGIVLGFGSSGQDDIRKGMKVLRKILPDCCTS
ncbi:transcriptional regulator, GntR family protein [Stappia aggregata IAM 12614]|jgi:GntR family transcriptional regulator/MocR family aminotransferase|uniref:Transcriptional regulator, GntR family protein n=1 Tax=Roseibium aggregatum (strain ATCC 25650 / DSM 13394 / JCM 20685 / NBRC 16684 / NCIMB 2208 / IAM 12614 / B1) TaxID=384765 RepID=A0NXM9_ROSAI|nr:PLP-dependent aminotransferase family protein [Roseibium aggregatum]EAV42556.1 transcriptional regulator, GntR family protein [Stappia aggregata IAM 12614] [Roseibium aggregatum IAM 12614]